MKITIVDFMVCTFQFVGIELSQCTEYGTIEETFSEEVINDIITWIKRL